MGLQTQFLKNAVLSYGTHIIYHTYRLSFSPLSHQRTALPRPSAKGSSSRPIPSFQLTEQSSQNVSAAQCINRVAKQLSITLTRMRWSLFPALTQSITCPAMPLPKLAINTELNEGMKAFHKRASKKTVFSKPFFNQLLRCRGRIQSDAKRRHCPYC